MFLRVDGEDLASAALSALVETETAYHFYFGIYVSSVSRFTRIYMTLIDPFRTLVVYPSLLRTVRTNHYRLATIQCQRADDSI